MRACLLLVCVVLLAFASGCAGGDGGATDVGTAPAPPSQAPTEPPAPPPPPEPLLAAECAAALARADGRLQTVIEASRARETALGEARDRVRAAEAVVADSRARLAGSEDALRPAEEEAAAARAALEDFEEAHPEQELPPAEYEDWQALVAAYEQARDRYEQVYEGYVLALGEHNDVVDAHNREVAAVNRTVRALTRLKRRHVKLSRLYQRDVVRCLAENETGIAAQQPHVEALEERLGALGTALAEREARAACSLVSWDKEPIVLGYVRDGSPVMYLAPPVCHALYGLVVLGERPDLACLARSREAKTPLCSAGADQLALAIKTVAHEAQHIAGVTNEARAECFGLQRTAEAASALGLEDEGQDLAWYAWRFSRAPDSYRSPECRPGGKLDRSPETPSWP